MAPFFVVPCLSHMSDLALGSSTDPAPAPAECERYSIIFHLTPSRPASCILLWKMMRRARGRIGQEVTACGLACLAPSLLFPIDVVQYSGAAIQCAGAALCFGLIIVGIAISPPELLVPTTFSRLAYASFELSFPHPQVNSFLVGRGAFIAVQT